MKLHKILTVLILLTLGQVNSSYSAQVVSSCTFQSQLRFNGKQWQVGSLVGPIYLARWEGNAWRVLAFFEGTNGKYHLDWENPTKGVYAALDSFGACSESLRIGDDRDRNSR